MGFLSNKTNRPELKRLPTGTFTIDPNGQIVSSTVPSWVPEALIKEIGRQTLAIFSGARRVNLEFSELVAQFAAYKITAREMRGGAIIFLTPRAVQSATAS